MHIHKWSKWEQYDAPFMFFKGSLAGEWVVRPFQRRTCEKCGKQQKETL